MPSPGGAPEHTMASAALIVGEAGNAATSIIEIVDDPESAHFAILGMPISAAGLKGGVSPRSAFKEAADARRALSASDMNAFSPQFRTMTKFVDTMVKSCNFK
ncbi:hypothetical protein ACHAPJ_011719 [Fusarium lateritium]